MLQLEEALERILATLPAPVPETLPLAEADGRFLLAPAVSALDLPPFANSAMDGYAVRSADVSLASAQKPVRLRVIGKVPAGQVFSGSITRGECVRLFTGSPLPAGADAVVMQEDTRAVPSAPDEVFITDAVAAAENVRFQGEDVRAGAVLAGAGDRLTPGRLSLLAAAGVAAVRVGRRPVVGLLATGSELKEPGQALAPGEVYESNRVGLAALARRAGALPRVWPIVPDDPDATRRQLEAAFADCDILITSGGVSVGEFDFVKAAFEKTGGNLQFWQIAIKPGKPFVFGRRETKFLFGLPGNPVSALVTFALLVRPALLRWQGALDSHLPAHPGRLARPLANPGPRRHFLRVRVDPAGNVELAGAQGSHVLSSLASADGLVEVGPDTVLPAGAVVQVLRWD